LQSITADKWRESGLTSDFAKVSSEFMPKLGEALAKPGRAGKTALRSAVKSLVAREAENQFPNGVLSNAESSRVNKTKPWYIRIPFGRSVLAGGLTLMLVVLPIIIIATQESLRSVSNSLRQASLAMGATKWQTIWNVTLPGAAPGMMTGIILAMSRAIGEAAPVMIIAGVVYITFIPGNMMDDFTALPLQIYDWASLPQEEFQKLAAAAIIVLLGILLCFNLVAILIRSSAQAKS
jgi:phosphate transport system permease protein